ncbi:MAG: hypothetical protein IJU84_03630, partial [Clostridia bacterium]|nr:hypothetical protein [Clostridia bacterium]
EYTADSKAAIDEAKAAYDALTDEQKALVDNANVLTSAEQTYATKEAEANKGLSGGAIAGIVIGSVFVLLIIACAVLFILNKKGILHIAFLDKFGKKN